MLLASAIILLACVLASAACLQRTQSICDFRAVFVHPAVLLFDLFGAGGVPRLHLKAPRTQHFDLFGAGGAPRLHPKGPRTRNSELRVSICLPVCLPVRFTLAWKWIQLF